MGTSGNRPGYKIFSINTTVRNPKRNYDFLKLFQKYDGIPFDNIVSYSYFFDLVRNGVYRLTDIPEYVKDKIDNGEQLTTQEVQLAIQNNPQATGLHGRAMTQLRSMKDQGFLRFENIKRGLDIIHVTSLGKELIENNIDPTIVYTKAMIGMHAKSPIRVKVFNESRPFLNTLFVINEVNNMWKALGHEPKGILRHEFATFVLSMKDCDYISTAKEIIKYRKQFKYKINKDYLFNYLDKNNILKIDENSLFKDYPDEVFRKFEMTGLIVKRGMFEYVYYDFSKYNIEKINTILKEYKDYKYETFNNVNEYYNYLESIEIPWDKSELIRKKIVQSKAEVLKIALDKNLTLEEQESLLDRLFYNKALESAIDKYSIEFINNELMILSGTCKAKSKLDDISEPLRLEYLLALLVGKKFGTSGLVSNIIYGENGEPLHYAPSKKCDIIYLDPNGKGAYIFEPTMQRGKNQILNSETTNIVRHMKDEQKSTGLVYRVAMIAPYIHSDVVSFFQFKAEKEKVCILPLNIDKAVGIINDSKSIIDLNNLFDSIVKELVDKDEFAFADFINQYNFK